MNTLANELKKYDFKLETLSLTINRIYTDVDGVVVDKVAVPAALQIAFPVFLFGNFDRSGGYKQCNVITPPMVGSYYVGSFTHGTGIPFLSFNVINNVKDYLKLGDIIHLYTDDLAAPTHFVWIIQSAQTVSLASVIENTSTEMKDGVLGKMRIKTFNYFTDAESQWDETINLINFDNLGNFKRDAIQPYMFRSSMTPSTQGRFIEVKFSWLLNSFMALTFYFGYETNEIKMNFKIQK